MVQLILGITISLLAPRAKYYFFYIILIDGGQLYPIWPKRQSNPVVHTPISVALLISMTLSSSFFGGTKPPNLVLGYQSINQLRLIDRLIDPPDLIY